MMASINHHIGPAYAELQTTTNFSFLRGGSHPEELVAQAKALGYRALAITDRNTLAGVVRAHVAAKEVGLKLIVGARLDLQDGPSLLCLPKNRNAYARLSRLLSLGQMRAEKGSCTLFLADVAAHSDGQILIVVPPENWDWREACAPIVARSIARGVNRQHKTQDHAPNAHNTFEAQLARIKAILPQAPLYLALSHRYRGDERTSMAALQTLSQRNAIPLVATGDILYHAPHRRPLQDVLTCVHHGTKITEAGFLLQTNAERHLKPPREIARLFSNFEDAIARTKNIADACQFSLDELKYEYPEEPVPEGKTAQSHLEDLTWNGAKWRFPDGIPDNVRATLNRELALIAELNYAHYFLTVHDIVTFARAQNILCQGRGSAANSIICYCLGITAVNPTEVDLLFERFVSAERKEPPDIDVDFEHERREEVIQYIYARYGRERAGLAATVISYRARSAVRDVGKAMGLSQDTVSALAGMVWGTRSGDALPEKHVREAGIDPQDPLITRVLELTRELIGFPRHLSQHVGGFVLTRGPLTEVVPVGNAAMEDRTNIEWDKDDLDALGLLKVDVLGLGMLTCIHRAFDFLQTHHNLTITLARVPRDDKATYDMLCRADSLGVFQVESRAQMNMLPRLKPRCFYDLVIEVAIVRPGPIQGDMVHPYLRRRSGLEPEHYPSPHPDHGPPDELRQILGKTKGVPLFQEQAMRIAMVAAKFSDAEVNELRKAMATFRRRGTIGLLEDKMVSSMVARGYDPEFATRCFNQIKGFGEYGFPESHAASFAHLVYVSSWLKCHYPAAFAAALLNSQPMGFYAPAQIVRDAREHGVEAREPDVNLSDCDCTLESFPIKANHPHPRPATQKYAAMGGRAGGAGRHWPSDEVGENLEPTGKENKPALRLGLRQIDGLQKAEVEKIIAARTAGAFRDFYDLKRRAGIKHMTLETLAAADAFRSLGADRRQALWHVKGLARGETLPLFDWSDAREEGAEPDVHLPDMPLSEHVINDYQTLRLSLKAHPMNFLRKDLTAQKIIPCSALRTMKDGAFVKIAGLVLVRQRPGSAKGVVFMTLEDETGIANSVVWPKTLERYRKVVMGGRLILIHGRIQRHEDIIHVVSARLEDRSDWLMQLSEWAQDMKAPLANADEVLRPDPGSARVKERVDAENKRRPDTSHPRWAGHPRNERIIPKSRDFH